MSIMRFLGAAARGANTALNERDRLHKQELDEADAAIARAEKRLGGIQRAGSALLARGDVAGAAKAAEGATDAANQAYGLSLPKQSFVGEPVFKQGEEFIEHQGPPTTPGGRVGAMGPTQKVYDTGERNLNNPRTKAGVRAALMLPPKYDDHDPYKDLVDETTGEIAIPAQDNPYKVTAADQVARWKADRETRARIAAAGLDGALRRAEMGIASREDIAALNRAAADSRQERRLNDPLRRDKLYMDWARSFATSVESNLQRWISAKTKVITDPNTRETQMVTPGVVEIEAQRRQLEADYQRRNPPPPPPGGTGREDPFGNPNPPSAGPGGTARWAPIIKQASEQYGVPVEIIQEVMRQESGGTRTAKSPAGALGLMQLMPATARGLGVRDPWDPHQNIMGGTKYLRQMYDKTGSWVQALAAYNGGPGGVEYSRDPGHEHQRKWENPNNKGWAETRKYVPAIRKRLRARGVEISAEQAAQMAALYEKHDVTPGASDA